MQWREYLVSEIQDILRDTYSFYQTEQKIYQESELKKLLTRLDFMMSDYCRTTIFTNNCLNWTQFIRHFIAPEKDDIWSQNHFPLLNLNLLVNPTAQKKKKEDAKENYLYFEPSYQRILEVLQEPLAQIKEAAESFSIIERDLVPLVEIPKKNVFQVRDELPFLEAQFQEIENYCQRAYQEPSKILEAFTQYNVLFEKNPKHIFKNMFGESKERIIIDNISPELVDAEIDEFVKARSEIERLCVSQKHCGFFRVNTSQAKEGLINRANELIKTILDKVSDICKDNVDRIAENYTQMYNKISQFPKNEKELFDLKAVINSHE